MIQPKTALKYARELKEYLECKVSKIDFCSIIDGVDCKTCISYHFCKVGILYGKIGSVDAIIQDLEGEDENIT